MPQEVISHLLEIFFTVVNHQQLPLLSPEYGLDWFVDRECPLSLVVALCSLSVGYSSHESASNDQSPRLDERLVSACRLMLLKPGANNQYLDNMLSLCALASHEVNKGNGAQAWCDIGEMKIVRGASVSLLTIIRGCAKLDVVDFRARPR